LLLHDLACFFFSSRRRHTRFSRDWSSDVCSSDLNTNVQQVIPLNFIVNKMFGITQTFIFKPAKWWDVNASADVYYSNTNSKIPRSEERRVGKECRSRRSRDR